MESFELKDIWHTQVGNLICNYSDPELNRIVIKQARKSMRRLYLGRPALVVALLVIGYLIWKIAMGEEGIMMTLFRSFLVLLLLVLLSLEACSAHKMRRYQADMPVKDWLTYRIAEVEKSLRFMKKHDIWLYPGALLLGLAVGVVYDWLLNTSFNLMTSLLILSCLILYMFFVRWTIHRNYSRVLMRLKELAATMGEGEEPIEEQVVIG